jgi:hypothetical protein
MSAFFPPADFPPAEQAGTLRDECAGAAEPRVFELARMLARRPELSECLEMTFSHLDGIGRLH